MYVDYQRGSIHSIISKLNTPFKKIFLNKNSFFFKKDNFKSKCNHFLKKIQKNRQKVSNNKMKISITLVMSFLCYWMNLGPQGWWTHIRLFHVVCFLSSTIALYGQIWISFYFGLFKMYFFIKYVCLTWIVYLYCSIINFEDLIKCNVVQQNLLIRKFHKWERAFSQPVRKLKISRNERTHSLSYNQSLQQQNEGQTFL